MRSSAFRFLIGCSAMLPMIIQVATVAAYAEEGAPSFLLYPKSTRKLEAAQRMLEFGDYAAYPDSCPFLTSCPAICVANETGCPTSCDPGLELCETGLCLEDCSAETNVVENPCYCEDRRPFACAKVIDEYETCFERFQEFYDANEECLEVQEDSTPMVDENGPYYMACYIILGVVSGLVVLWCFFNTHSPVKDCTASLASPDKTGEAWTLTGYRYHPIGIFIYASVIFTLLGFQFLLFLLTIFYYMQQEAITRWQPVFYDEVQVLKAFQIVWMVGIVWAFAFRYPSSIRDLFLRKCPLSAASFIAAEAPTKTFGNDENDIPGWGERLMASFWFPFDFCLRVVYSYPYKKPGYETVFCPVETDDATGKRGFYYRMRRFVYDDHDGKTSSFQPGTISIGKTLGDMLDQRNGLSSDEAKKRLGLTGPNRIPMRKPTIFGSIVQEFSKPFYLYQNFMVWSWAPYWYYYMAIVNSIVRVAGGVIVGVFQYMSDSNLYQISQMQGHSTVLRDGKYIAIDNTAMVPGDVVVLKPGVVCCDMVVLAAERLVVDESALTGEANPILKFEVDPAMASVTYNLHRNKTNILSAGTEILETGEGRDLGLCLATASFTTKGKLVTEVLSYQRHKFKFDDEVKTVLCILMLEAVFLIGMVFHFIDEDQWVYAWFYAVFVLGTVIPPLLPTVFVVSVGISAKRLQANRITCTYQEGILIAGKVNYAFFDKTGTLTKQGMDFISLGASTDELKGKATLGMSVCHTLCMSRDEHLVGNNVDTVSFNYSGAQLVQRGGAPSQVKLGEQSYEILKQYEFDSHLQTQSVIIEDSNGNKTVFVKGSPEAIRELCASGVPPNFDETVRSKSGMYTLAIAFKDYDLEDAKLADIRREDVEASLQFGAFLNFQNIMREETPAVIRELLEGSVSVAMITGDSVLTGIFIAKASGMIPEGKKVFLAEKSSDGEIYWSHEEEEIAKPSEQMLDARTNDVVLAITGEAWTALLRDDPKYASMIAEHIAVFGRCNPSDKVSVVAHFVEEGYTTLMCGDGQNDCGSLKSAHVGIALSTAEASVVAPFTSLDKCITSVPEVLREGRCALASAFSAYSFYIVYGQLESYLQVINAYFAITFTEWSWVFLDGIWSISMAFTLPLAKSAKKLSPTRPTASLLGPRTMASVCGLLIWNFLFLVIALVVLWNEDFFSCRKWNSGDVSDVKSLGDNYETTVLFLVGGYQYIASAVSLNFGYTWRENFWKNYVFVFLAIVFTVMQFVVTIHPSKFSCIWRVNCDNRNAVRWVTTPYPVAISNPWNTTVMPVEFRWKLVGIMAGNLIVLCLWQYFFVNGYLAKQAAAMTASSSSPEKDRESLQEKEPSVLSNTGNFLVGN